MTEFSKQFQPPDEKFVPIRLLLPTLVISRFVTQSPQVLTRLLLIDIGVTFGYSVGVIGQVQTMAALVATLSALMMGILSVKFKPKSLLLLGLVVCIISALGCAFAINFPMMIFFYAISGLGLVMVVPMVLTLTSTYFPLKKQTIAIGWISIGAALASLVGAPIVGVIASFGGWRWAFLWFLFPITLLSLTLSAKGVPSPSHLRDHHVSQQPQYLNGFKGVFSSRSALACLLSRTLTLAAWQASVLYSVSFFRERFLVSTGFASGIIMGLSLFFTLGALIVGRVSSRFRIQPLTIVTAILAGIFTISFMYGPTLWLALTIEYLGIICFGMLGPTSTILTLEQVPQFRGTLMSLNSAATNLGVALGAGIGGLVLVALDYEFVGLVLGSLYIIAALIYYLGVSGYSSLNGNPK